MKPRKRLCMMLMMLLISILVISVPVSAKSISKTKRKKICKEYHKQYEKLEDKYEEVDWYFYDINKDGIYEMIVYINDDYQVGWTGQGAVVYTYNTKKNKVVRLKTFTGLSWGKYNERAFTSGKNIVVYARDGSDKYSYYVYTLKSNKLKRTATYMIQYKANKTKYYKNGKNISAKTYKKFEKTLKRFPYTKTSNAWTYVFLGLD